MSMETDILSQNNRDKIKALTGRLDKLENVGAQSEDLKEAMKQILLIWDSMTLVAKSIAKSNDAIKNLSDTLAQLQYHHNELNKLVNGKKPRKKRKKAA